MPFKNVVETDTKFTFFWGDVFSFHFFYFMSMNADRINHYKIIISHGVEDLTGFILSC